MKTSIILPAYNEEENIGKLIEGIFNVLGRGVEVLVVDDASADKTADIARSCGAKVIRHPYNLGNGAAVKTGLRNAAGDVVVLMDADGQHNPEDLPKLLKHINKYDMVVGARSKKTHQNFWRKFANVVYSRLASYVAGTYIPDLTSGFRAMKLDVAKHYIYLLPNTFSYPSTLTLSFLKSGRPVKFVDIDVASRKGGKSKINIFSDGMRFFLIIAKITVLFSPLKVFLPLSFIFFVLGWGYYAYTFVHYHRFTNMSALLLTTSVIIFMLGLVSEQIAFLRAEKTER
jgi:glycosyltransferase involved in cell wall biosynthesis